MEKASEDCVKLEIDKTNNSLNYLNQLKNNTIDCSKEITIPIIEGLAYFNVVSLRNNNEEILKIHLADNNRFVDLSLDNSITFFNKKLKNLQEKLDSKLNSDIFDNNKSNKRVNNEDLTKLDDNIFEIKEKFDDKIESAVLRNNIDKNQVDSLELELSKLKINMLKPIENYSEIEKNFENLIQQKKLEKLKIKEIEKENLNKNNSDKSKESETIKENNIEKQKSSKNVKFADDVIEPLNDNKSKKKKKDVIKLD
jgi:hypothetical protein